MVPNTERGLNTSPKEETQPEPDMAANEPSMAEMALQYRVDSQEVGTEIKLGAEVGEPGNDEYSHESFEAFANARTQYEDLKTKIEENKLDYFFGHEIERAGMNIQVAESVAQNKDYSEERKVSTATNATNYLNDLNSRLSAELARLSTKTETEPSYATSEPLSLYSEAVPVADTESVPVATIETTPVVATAPVENAPAVVSAETEPVVATTEKTPDASIAPEAALSKYQEKRAEWREYNKIFKKTESEYKLGLADYYERRGGLEKMRTGARSLLGLEPKFPAEVAELQARYSEAKKFYALEFSKVLALRGEAHEGNADYSLNRKEMKRGMAQKFILKPAEQLLDLQKETALAESERSTTKKIMGLMSKHKWGVRVGTVLLAGTIGFASGGLSVALTAGGMRAARMAAGMAGGALAGAGVNRAMQGYTETGEKNVASAEANARENFDLANLDELEAELLSAQADKGTRDARRTAATVLAAGAAGYGSGMLATELPLGASVADYSNEGRNYPASANDENYSHEGNNYPPSTNNPNYSNEGLNHPNPVVAGEALPSNVHEVSGGDNLWNIMKTEYADALKDLPPAEQNRVLAELFERAKTDVTLRESIGLRDSSDLGSIYPGEKLELQGLGNELQEIIDQGRSETLPTSPVLSSEITESAILDAVDTEAIPTNGDSTVSLDRELSEMYNSQISESLAPRPYAADGNYFAVPEYRDFALGSMGGFEQITNTINRAIDSVEGKQDIFEAMQGKPRVFDALKGLTVDTINNMGKTPGAIENFAATNGVEENILREWLHNFDQIKKSDLPRMGTTTFGDLFTRSVIENHVNNLFK